jgi:hypothetical protein
MAIGREWRAAAPGEEDKWKEPPKSKNEYAGLGLDAKTVEARRGEARRFIAENRRLFAGIAGDNSLDFRLGDWFMIDLQAGVVYLPEDKFVTGPEEGWDQDMILWAVTHELSHFRDLRENAEGMLKNFEYLWDRAAELAPRVLEVWRKKTEGGVLPDYLTAEVKIGRKGNTKPWVEFFIYQHLHRDVYNALDDMYVNKTNETRVLTFAPGGSKHEKVYRLYRDLLFPTAERGVPPEPLQAADYAKALKSSQLGNYLLRRRMVPDQPVLVHEAVRDALDSFLSEAARSRGLTLERRINSVTQPGEPSARDPQWRYQRIRELVEPKWLELFFTDLEEQPVPRPRQEDKEDKEGKGRKPKPQADPWEDRDLNPEPIDLDVIKDFIEQQKQKEKEDKREEARRKEWEQMDAEEREDKYKEESDDRLCREFGIDPSWGAAYREIEESIKPYKRQLEDVFEGLMATIAERVSFDWEEGYRSGSLTVNEIIRKYAAELVAEEETGRPAFVPWDQLDVFARKEFFSRVEIVPNEIRVRLVIDGSGSMAGDRINYARQMAVLFMEGLSSFEETMNLEFRMKTPLKVNTEVTMFGSAGAASVVKGFDDLAVVGPAGLEPERAKRIRALGAMEANYGGTCAADPHWNIVGSIDEDLQRRLIAGKTLELIFHITDGGEAEVSLQGRDLVGRKPAQETVKVDEEQIPIHPAAMQDTRNAVQAEVDKGAIVRGLQIGEVWTPKRIREEYERLPIEGRPKLEDFAAKKVSSLQPWEQYQFAKVWGDNGRNVPHPSDLPPAAADMLAEEIAQVQFKVRMYETSGE